MVDHNPEMCSDDLDGRPTDSPQVIPSPQAIKKEKSADIAIVGMACMFAKAKDMRRFWRNICNRIDAIQEVPTDRWQIDDFYSEDRLARDRVYSKWGGFLEEVVFDPVKWRIPPASLRHIEPMQLLSLEVAWQAMLDAGYERRPFPHERAGVLFAVSGSHELGTAYCFRTMMRHYLPRVEGLSPEVREQIYASLEKQLPEWTEDSFPGFLGNVIAGRIAREFDFNGPNFTVDAACAGSLAAVFTAVEQLRSDTSDLMLVGAADGTNNPFGYMSFAKTHALSPRGRSRAFDDSADGIGLGEGIACILLKRLPDAERDGDKIYAVIKGIGSSSDGKNRSLTAPHPPGQSRAVNRAYEDAQYSPASVTLIEAHGTGTAVGDSAELATLSQVFAKHTHERQYVAVGSVKSMIGHTKTAAGLASLIKTALALEHQVLPPTIGIEKPNTRIDLEQTPFYLNTETRPWVVESPKHEVPSSNEGKPINSSEELSSSYLPRRAGISSFGFGGTNFHVTLEEYTKDYLPGGKFDWMPRAVEVIVLQRLNRDEIVCDLQNLQQGIASLQTDDLAGLAGAIFAEESNGSSRPRTSRLAIVAESVEDLRQKITKAIRLLRDRSEVNDPRGIYHSEAAPLRASEVCFLYPGQGSQSVNMLRDLVVGCPWSHSLFLEANRLLRKELPQALSRYIYPPPVFNELERERQTTALRDTRVAQPALGVVELFATALLERFDVRPALVAGHSYGEHVALHVAGSLSRTDLVQLSAYRGRVCAEVARACPGAMASIKASGKAAAAALQELNIPAHLANLNGPDQTVIAGPEAVIEAAVEELTNRGLPTRKIPVSAAFHTTQLTSASEMMRAYLERVSFQQPRLPVYSNTTGQCHGKELRTIRDLLSRHLSEPVLFEKEVRQIYHDGARLFLEVGPGNVLTSLVSRILQGESLTALALDVPGRDGWTQLGHVVARLAVLGLPLRIDAWFEGRGLTSASLREFIDRTQTENTPKPSNWILAPHKAEPITPLPDHTLKSEANVTSTGLDGTGKSKVTSSTANGASAKSFTTTPTASVTAVCNNERREHSTITPGLKPEEESSAMTKTNEDGEAQGDITRMGPPNDDLLAHFQATTRLLLETQQAQNHLLERYLEMQERLLLHCTQDTPTQSSRRGTLPDSSDSSISAFVPPTGESGLSAPASRVRPRSSVVRPPVAIPRPVPLTPSCLAVASSESAERSLMVPVPASPRNGSTAAAEVASHVVTSASCVSENGEGPPSTEKFRQDLLEVVSTRTGYPIDALDETLALEAELGIDSIKTVEIFSNLKSYHSYFRADDQEEEELLAEFTKLKTLNDIINAYDRRRQAYHAGTQTNGAPKPVEEKLNGSVERYSVTTVAAPLEDGQSKKKRFPDSQLLLVIGEVRDVASAVMAALSTEGCRVRQVLPGEEAREIRADRYEVDLSSPQSVQALHRLLIEREGALIGGVINFLGLSLPSWTAGAEEMETTVAVAQWTFNLVKEFGADLRTSTSAGGGWFVNLTALGGRYGLDSSVEPTMAGAGTLGIVKTLHREYPGLFIKNIDIDPRLPGDLLAVRLLQELAAADDVVEIGLTSEGRWRTTLTHDPVSRDLLPLAIDQESVILVTGGACGVTADVARGLAASLKPHLILVGRSPLPTPESLWTSGRDKAGLRQLFIDEARAQGKPILPAEIDRSVSRILKDRQIRANLEACATAGATVEYHAIDVRDTECFGRLIDNLYERFGRIDGVVHGAGVIEDKRIPDKTLDSFNRVFGTKVDSAWVLARKLRPETLKFLVFFGSVSGRFGNVGQVDYSAANEVLNKLADRLNHRWPGRVACINWGPWDGGMVSDELRHLYATAGLDLISTEEGVASFLSEIRIEKRPSAEVLLARSVERMMWDEVSSQ